MVVMIDKRNFKTEKKKKKAKLQINHNIMLVQICRFLKS